jgi:hypothetical protein
MYEGVNFRFLWPAAASSPSTARVQRPARRWATGSELGYGPEILCGAFAGEHHMPRASPEEILPIPGHDELSVHLDGGGEFRKVICRGAAFLVAVSLVLHECFDGDTPVPADPAAGNFPSFSSL